MPRRRLRSRLYCVPFGAILVLEVVVSRKPTVKGEDEGEDQRLGPG